MKIAIPNKLDDMNLSPEAYRLYLHFRCEIAKQVEANMIYDGLTLELNRKTVEVLDKCKIKYGTSDKSILRFVLELVDRRLVTIEHEFILTDGFYDSHLQTVAFLPEEVWQ